MSRICALDNRMLWTFDAYLSHMRSMPVEASLGSAFQCGRILRSTRTNLAGMRLSGGEYRTWNKCMRLLYDELCTHRSKCIGARCVRFGRTWYTLAWGMRSICGCVPLPGMWCKSVDNPGFRSHARQSHNDRKPCTRSLAFTFHYHFSLWSAAFPDPADSLTAAFRDPADGLRCSGLFETPLIDSRDRL